MRICDEDSRKRLLPAIASGKSIGTLAVTEQGGRWDLNSIAMAVAYFTL